MKRLLSDFSRNRQLPFLLADRLERILEERDPQYLVRLARETRDLKELIRRYSNDSML